VKQQYTLTATSILTTKSTYRGLSAQRLSERTVFQQLLALWAWRLSVTNKVDRYHHRTVSINIVQRYIYKTSLLTQHCVKYNKTACRPNRLIQYYSGDKIEKNGMGPVLVWKPEWKSPLGRPKRRWEDNIKMDLEEVGCGVWTGSSWLRMATGGGHCDCGNKPSGSITMRGISWLAANQLASQEGLCSME
jgi:hypothetical protein